MIRPGDHGPRWGRRAAAALLLCLFAGCTPTKEQTARPAIWRVSDTDTTIYLLGSMHALPAGTRWDGGVVGQAITQADSLVLELAPAEVTRAGPAFARLAPRSSPLAVERRLTGKAWSNYQRAVRETGIDGAPYDDWALTILLGQQSAQQAGMRGENGVESGLAAHFQRAGKPVMGLETADQQMMLFETLPPLDQRALLILTAEQLDGAVRDVTSLASAWSHGDVKALERLINEDIDAIPVVREQILTRRNHNWAKWIETRMEQPGTILVAVGAGHLLGPDGVPALLTAKGLSITRLQ